MSPRILIVGGGIAGLASARALRRVGIESEIVEIMPEWDHSGAGMYLPANGFRALKALDLHTPVAMKGFVIGQQRFLNHRGRLLKEIDLAAVWGKRSTCLGLLRRDLHSALLAGASDAPLRMGTSVANMRAKKRAVEVSFSDGTAGEYDLVVGADGVRSSVRRLAFWGADPYSVGQVSWRFVVDGLPDLSAWTALLGRHKAFLAVPLGGSRVYCYCDVSSDSREDPTAGDLAAFRALFGEFGGPVPDILGRIEAQDARYFSPIEEVIQTPQALGRVLLIGDAAHATSPNMAEGASMALEDATVLAETLSAGGPMGEALTAFTSRRSARTAWVRQQTHRRDRTRSLPGLVRDLVLRAAGRKIFMANYRPLLDEP